MRETFRDIIALIFDERSMIGAEDLGIIEKYCKQIVHNGTNENMLFGGIPVVILVGDDYQLPPVLKPGAATSLNPKYNINGTLHYVSIKEFAAYCFFFSFLAF